MYLLVKYPFAPSVFDIRVVERFRTEKRVLGAMVEILQAILEDSGRTRGDSIDEMQLFPPSLSLRRCWVCCHPTPLGTKRFVAVSCEKLFFERFTYGCLHDMREQTHPNVSPCCAVSNSKGFLFPAHNK